MGKTYGFSAGDVRRIKRAVQKSERDPRPSSQGASGESGDDLVGTFVIASDPSDYSEAEGLLPLGYRGHVIAYRLLKDFDLSGLPTVPTLDSLLRAEEATEWRGVREWAQHPWVDQYKDETLGPPVVINICRCAKGQFFRGQIVQAEFRPGFLRSDAYRGSEFGYSVPTYGEWPAPDRDTTEYESKAGWCAIGGGYTSLVVTLTSTLDPSDEDEPYATATIKPHQAVASGEHDALFIPPDGAEAADGPTLYVYGDAGTCGSEDEDAVIHWDHFRFHWQMHTSRARIGRPDSAIDIDTTGTVSVYKRDATGELVDTGSNVEVNNLFGDVDADMWIAFVPIDGVNEILSARCVAMPTTTTTGEPTTTTTGEPTTTTTAAPTTTTCDCSDNATIEWNGTAWVIIDDCNNACCEVEHQCVLCPTAIGQQEVLNCHALGNPDICNEDADCGPTSMCTSSSAGGHCDETTTTTEAP